MFSVKRHTNTRNSQPGKKKRLGFFGLFVFAVTSISLVLQPVAYAADINFPADSDTKIQKQLLTRFVGTCLSIGTLSGGIGFDLTKRITGNKPANSGDWFYGGDGTPIGAYMNDSRFGIWSSINNQHPAYDMYGGGSCGDEKTMLLALKSLGVANGVTFLCQIGFVRSDGSDGGTTQGCVAGNGDFKYPDDDGVKKVYNKFKSTFPEPTLSDADLYWYYRKTFNWSCGYGKMSTPVDKATAEASKDYGYGLVYATDTAPDYKETKYFIGQEKTNKSIVISANTAGYINNNTDVSVKMSCVDIEGQINKYGDKYAARLAQLASEGKLNDELDKEAATDAAGVNSDPSCGVEGVGWLVCPAMSFLGDISSTALDFLSSTFLETKSSVVSSTQVQNAWSIMRNIANVGFVIAFLIIIFSQLSSIGVSNYGVKKLLPRLVVAAILVNMSLFVCQLAVDISNILGYSLASLFNGGLFAIDGASTADASGNGFGVATIVLAAIAGGVTLLLAVTVPVILAVVVALLMIVLILIARQALIVLLIVIAPLAFVAYLLPNTEQWFKKWYKMFFALLLVFPIIAVVFGASSLAAKIIYDTADGNVLLQLTALGVAALPLFVVPSLLKGSMNAAGSIGARLSKMSDKSAGKIGAKVKDTSRLGALNAARQRNAQVKRAQITGGVFRGSNRNPLNWGRNASSRISAALNSSRVTGAAGNRVAAQSAQLANKLEIENVEAANAQIEQANVPNDALARVAHGQRVGGLNGSDPSMRAAAMEQLAARGDFAGFEAAWDHMVTEGHNPTMRSVASTMARSRSKPAFIGAGDLQTVGLGSAAVADSGDSFVLSDIAVRGVRGNRYSPAALANAPQQELSYVVHNAFGGVIPPEMHRSATTATTTPEIDQHLGRNRQWVEAIAGIGPVPPP